MAVQRPERKSTFLASLVSESNLGIKETQSCHTCFHTRLPRLDGSTLFQIKDGKRQKELTTKRRFTDIDMRTLIKDDKQSV